MNMEICSQVNDHVIVTIEKLHFLNFLGGYIISMVLLIHGL